MMMAQKALLARCPAFLRVWVKEYSELSFWRSKYEDERVLRNNHYEYFYTTFFGLDPNTYNGKRILDVGCGPRGSLEWADRAIERIGLDPLVDRYQKLGINSHKMKYCKAPVEAIPYPDGYFDIVMSFNSLDHVNSLGDALFEICRVTKNGGLFLLIVETNHEPTATEPIQITTEALREELSHKYSINSWNFYSINAEHDIYRSLREGGPQPNLANSRPGIVTAMLTKLDAFA